MDGRLQQRLYQAGAGNAAAPTDAPQVDTSEQIYISSLALLKMLKHGAGHLPPFRSPSPPPPTHLFECCVPNATATQSAHWSIVH